MIADAFKTVINGLISVANMVPLVNIPLLETSEAKTIKPDTSKVENQNVDIAKSAGFQQQSGQNNVIVDAKSSTGIVTPPGKVIRADVDNARNVAIA